jgi:hypothetical protein
VNVFEWSAAAVLVLLGIRSLVHWLGRPLLSDSRRDRVLYALFVVSRAGLWFALAGLFLLYGLIDAKGRAFIDLANELRWYFFVLAIPAAGQFVTGFLLGRRGHDAADGPDVGA